MSVRFRVAVTALTLLGALHQAVFFISAWDGNTDTYTSSVVCIRSFKTSSVQLVLGCLGSLFDVEHLILSLRVTHYYVVEDLKIQRKHFFWINSHSEANAS